MIAFHKFLLLCVIALSKVSYNRLNRIFDGNDRIDNAGSAFTVCGFLPGLAYVSGSD